MHRRQEAPSGGDSKLPLQPPQHARVQSEGSDNKSVHIANSRANHLERFFGRQARNGMKLMGGIESVAIALSGIS